MNELTPQQISDIKNKSGNKPVNEMVLTAGRGISISSAGNSHAISIKENFQRTLTIDVCVNGSPKKFDIYIARGPY